MSDATSPDFEALLKQAFAPVEPPASLAQELENRLTRLNEAAWDELESWELQGDRREALIMRFALGMDNREIARALGRTDGATKVLLHRSIKKLEEIVSDES